MWLFYLFYYYYYYYYYYWFVWFVLLISLYPNIFFLGVNMLILLFQVHYLPPGFSLDDFIKCYNPDENQGKYVWCYEFIDAFEKLFLGFPSRAAFYSNLKNKHITEDEYQRAWQLYRDHNCQNLLDLLKVYNNQDVVPFLAAIENMFGIFKWDHSLWFLHIHWTEWLLWIIYGWHYFST